LFPFMSWQSSKVLVGEFRRPFQRFSRSRCGGPPREGETKLPQPSRFSFGGTVVDPDVRHLMNARDGSRRSDVTSSQETTLKVNARWSSVWYGLRPEKWCRRTSRVLGGKEAEMSVTASRLGS